MKRAGSVRVTVDFAGKKRAGDYVVKISPEGGDVVGSYGGSGNIDAKDQLNFAILPPGRYILTGPAEPGLGQRGGRAGHDRREGRPGGGGHAEGEVRGPTSASP